MWRSLKVGMTLRRGQGEGHWVGFKYEKLPSFCFVCGIIGHADRYCPLAYENTNLKVPKKYGASLRAGGGGTSQSFGGNKWLVPEGQCRKENGIAGTSRREWNQVAMHLRRGLMGKPSVGGHGKWLAARGMKGSRWPSMTQKTGRRRVRFSEPARMFEALCCYGRTLELVWAS
ncbi:unnamed protein product [Cuscuta epithymum]|uniref:CCHC-type domain-containing protein n=1 Tax=Cuscuta epithymum TaxID=186058 RepID=A0AAV0D6Z9_9ASTE|nr:unnamed protein product [Cuscuta epithymum]